jgi:hypothetical protein
MPASRGIQAIPVGPPSSLTIEGPENRRRGGPTVSDYRDRYEPEMAILADRIGAPANADDGAFDKIKSDWSESDGSRITCLELGDLARMTIRWVHSVALSVPSEIFAIVEQILDEYRETPAADMVIGAFISPCFFEALDVELREIADSLGEGPAAEVANALERLMGSRSKAIWLETYV